MGTLKRLYEDGYNIVAVVTQPDRPVGRHQDTLQPSEVKKYALAHGLPILQPEKMKDPTFIEQLASYKADLQIVVAFRMLPEVVWSRPRFGTFNVHAALLPQYRGAAPINWAIINGETETGVTTFFLDPGAPYQKVVPAMFANNASATDIAKAYFEFYADENLYTGKLPYNWGLGDPWTAGVSVSVVNTSMLEQLDKSSSEIIPKYIKGRQAIATSGILCYDCRSSKYYYDFDGLIRSLGSETSEYEAWKAAYDAAVVYWKTTPNNYSSYGGSFSMNGSAGLSTYIFRQSYEEEINPFYRQSIQWYSAAGWDETGW